MKENKLEAILVDDELPALKVLKYLIDLHCPQIKVIKTFTSPLEAQAYISSNNPDIAFVDIRMPQKDGIQLLEKLKDTSTKFIFTTAHQEYSLKAWKTPAVGYILKPIDPDDLIEAVNKVLHLSENDNSQTSEIVIGGETYFPDQILVGVASGSYTKLRCVGNKTAIVTRSLKHVFNLLPEDRFFRNHRSAFLNAEYISNFNSKTRIITLMDDYILEVSERRLNDFNKFLKKNGYQW